jgi:hypothetical protein
MSISDFLAIIASIVTLASGIAVIIRNLQNKTKRQPMVISGIIVAIIVIIAIAVAALRNIPITVNGQSTFALGLGNGKVATIAPTGTPTPQPIKLGDGVININKEVTCNNCDTPFKVVIQTATINNNLGNVALEIQTTNRQGITHQATINTIVIKDNNGNSYSGSGSWEDDGFPLNADSGYIAPYKSVMGQATFSFVPYASVTYILSINMGDSFTGPSSVKYDNLSFTFQQ